MNLTSAKIKSPQNVRIPDSDPFYLEKWLLGTHQITPEEYNFRKQLYFCDPTQSTQPQLPPDMTIFMNDGTMESLVPYVNSLYRGFQNVVFNVDFGNRADNSEIALLTPPWLLQPAPAPAKFNPNIVTFSAYFFEGIRDFYQDTVTTINITKVVSLMGNNFGHSIAFQLVDNNGNVYCADLSGVYP